MDKYNSFPSIHISCLGPIKECNIDVNRFSVFTGPQASGKSTVAKAIFFCQSIKMDVFSEISKRTGENEINIPLISRIERRLRKKFLGIFGSSWAMSMDMHIE